MWQITAVWVVISFFEVNYSQVYDYDIPLNILMSTKLYIKILLLRVHKAATGRSSVVLFCTYTNIMDALWKFGPPIEKA